VDIAAVIRDVEDLMFPRFAMDTWERALYWHLLRHSHLEGRSEVVIGIDTLSRQTGISTTKLRETIRSLNAKGTVVVDDRSRAGHALRVVLPADIPGLHVQHAAAAPDIEALDFFTERRFLQPLMERQRGACFYCLRTLTAEASALDHVISQVAGGNNSHRNVVVACHACNSRKQDLPADEYLRALYRDGVLGQTDLTERLHALAQVQAGELPPPI
jgi:hypothetical protein